VAKPPPPPGKGGWARFFKILQKYLFNGNLLRSLIKTKILFIDGMRSQERFSGKSGFAWFS